MILWLKIIASVATDAQTQTCTMPDPPDPGKPRKPQQKGKAAKRPVEPRRKQNSSGLDERRKQNSSRESSLCDEVTKKMKVEGKEETNSRTFQFTPFQIPEGKTLWHYLSTVHCMCEELLDEPFVYTMDQIEAIEKSLTIIDFCIASCRVTTKRFIPPVDEDEMYNTHASVLQVFYSKNRELRGKERSKLMAYIPEELAQQHRVVLDLPREPPTMAATLKATVMEHDQAAEHEVSKPSISRQAVETRGCEPTSSSVRNFRYWRTKLKLEPSVQNTVRERSLERIRSKHRLTRAGLAKDTLLDAKFVIMTLAPYIPSVRILTDNGDVMKGKELSKTKLDNLALVEESHLWTQVPPCIHVLPNTGADVRGAIARLADTHKMEVILVQPDGEERVDVSLLVPKVKHFPWTTVR